MLIELRNKWKMVQEVRHFCRMTEVFKLILVQCGGGANTKVPDMYGVGGCFRDPKHKSNMYTFVQQRGVVHLLSRITKV